MSSTASPTCRRAWWSSEYVDVAHAFVDRDETGMVNAVLDQLARQLRAGEFERPRGEAVAERATQRSRAKTG